MRILTLAGVSLFLFWGWLLFSNSAVLLKEAKVRPGDTYFAEGYGNLGNSKQNSLVCRWFNGRKIIERVYWYAPNDFMGKSTCQFIVKY